MARGRDGRVLAALALALAPVALAAACAEPPAEPAARAEERAVAAPILAALRPDAPAPLCDDVARIVAAGENGFSSLRDGAPRRADRLAGGASWRGGLEPDGFVSCEIQGDRAPSATYVCRGGGSAMSGAPLLPAFEEAAATLRACFADRVSWHPRDWREATAFAFAGGEAQVFWRDIVPYPKPTVALKLEEDFTSGRFYLRLSIGWLR